MRPVMAAKYSIPFTSVRYLGTSVCSPGQMSLTSTVPASVPSLFQSSSPFVPSSAMKYSMPFTFVS